MEWAAHIKDVTAPRWAVLLSIGLMLAFALHSHQVAFHCVQFQRIVCICSDSITLQKPPSSVSLISPFLAPSIYIFPKLVSNLVSILLSHCTASALWFYREAVLVSALRDTAESEPHYQPHPQSPYPTQCPPSVDQWRNRPRGETPYLRSGHPSGQDLRSIRASWILFCLSKALALQDRNSI